MSSNSSAPSPSPGGEIDWSDPGHPRSALYGDTFASRAGALAQARAVFLQGNGLPQRWQGRRQFVILETGFGLGNNFLATWDAWRHDPSRCDRLFFLSLDAHPVSADDLARAQAHSPLADLGAELRRQWPPRVPGWHQLSFEGGAVQLLLAIGDIRQVLPQWQASVDAFFLDGFAPRLNPAMWSKDALTPLGRLAAVGATAATWSAARVVRDALQSAGFACERVAGFGGKAQMTKARYVPTRQHAPAGRRALAPGASEAVVIGAGIAGAACARALQEAGLNVRVFEAGAHPASGASGNPAGMFHGTVHADDGPHAQWNRTAALRTQAWLHRHPPPWLQSGLLRLAPDQSDTQRHDLISKQKLDAVYVQSVDAALARAWAGVEVPSGGWFYPGGGALPPGPWVRTLLANVQVRTEQRVSRVGPGNAPGRWELFDTQGHAFAETDLLVLACGAQLPELLAPLCPLLSTQLRAQRGQISHWLQQSGPALPLAGGGYVLALPDGGLLAGATTQFDDDDHALRLADHAHNQAVGERMMNRALPEPDGGRVAWRLLMPDRLPLVGGLPDPHQTLPRRVTQPAHWPRWPGLAVCGAMASRGLSWAPLCAEMVVAQALGWPSPVPRALQDATDPARWHARHARTANKP